MRHNATETVTILYSSFYTQLLNLLGPDHTGSMAAPGLGQLPHLTPGQGGRVKLQNNVHFYGGGITIVASSIFLASCTKLQSTLYLAY